MNNTDVNMTIEEEEEIINPQAVPISEEFDVAVDDQGCPIIKETYDPSRANGPFYQHSSDVAEQVINNGANVQLVQANIENRQDVLAGAMDPLKIAKSIQCTIDTFMNSKLVNWFVVNRENSINEIIKNVDRYNEFLDCLYTIICDMRAAMSEVGITEFMQASDNLEHIYDVMSKAETNNETYHALILIMFGMCGQISQYTDNESYKQKAMDIMSSIKTIIDKPSTVVDSNDSDEAKKFPIDDIIDKWLPEEDSVVYETDKDAINAYYDTIIYPERKKIIMKYNILPRKDLGYVTLSDYVKQIKQNRYKDIGGPCNTSMIRDHLILCNDPMVDINIA